MRLGISADVGDACREALAHALLETLQERGCLRPLTLAASCMATGRFGLSGADRDRVLGVVFDGLAAANP